MTQSSYISHTQIDTYLRCPFLYGLIYREAFQRPDSPVLQFGRAIHHALHQYSKYYAHTQQHNSAIMRGMWELTCENSKVVTKALSPEDYKKGLTMLTSLVDSGKLDLSSAVAFEQEFLVDFGGVAVKGVIDRVDELQDGVYRIVDYKTGGSIYSGDDIENSLQLGMYAAAFELMHEEHVRYLSVAVHQVNQNVFIERTKAIEDIQYTKRYVVDTYHRIATDQEMAPNPGASCLRYGGCPAAHKCPEHENVVIDGIDLATVESSKLLLLYTQLELRKKLLDKALRGRLEQEDEIMFGGRKAVLDSRRRYVPNLAVLYTLTDAFGLDPFDFTNFDVRKFEKAVREKGEGIQTSDRGDVDYMLEKLEEMRESAYSVELHGSQLKIKNE